jgi:DNA-binding beta-propeller fold protein YncE
VNLGILLGAVAAAVLLAGCGGGESFPRAAEPADSPPLSTRPDGVVAKIGERPEGMAFLSASGLLAVAIRGPNRLAFVDPATLKVERTVALPAPARHLAPAATGTAAIVPAEAANAVLEVSPRAGVVSSTAVGNHPHDATAAAGSVFVADEHSDQVSVVRGGRDVATLDAPVQPGGIATAGRYVVLVAVGERVLQVYDSHSRKALGTSSAGVGPTHVVAAGDDAYVADTEGGRVREFRIGPEPRQVASAPAPGAPYGIALDPRRHRLWVSLTASNRLFEYGIGAGSPRRLATYATVRQPNSVEVDPRSGDVFVGGAGDGELQRISPGGGAR